MSERLSPDIQDNERRKFFETAYQKVAVRTSNTPTFSDDSVYRFEPLLNAGSKSMRVLGSLATPVDFTFAPAAGETYYLVRVGLTIQHKGKMDANAFGAIPGGLANGVLIDIQSKGTLYTIGTLNDNLDISNVFVGGATPTSTGWFDTDDAFIGSLILYQANMKLVGDQGDFIRFRIRDDLTLLNFFRSSVLLWRVIT